MASLYIGTSAFTAAGWEGSFYPEGTKPADFLRRYAQHFNSVEVDSTFYRIPSEATVRGWASKTPDGFVFAAKIPQVITHEKVLVDCDDEHRPIETAELIRYWRRWAKLVRLMEDALLDVEPKFLESIDGHASGEAFSGAQERVVGIGFAVNAPCVREEIIPANRHVAGIGRPKAAVVTPCSKRKPYHIADASLKRLVRHAKIARIFSKHKANACFNCISCDNAGHAHPIAVGKTSPVGPVLIRPIKSRPEGRHENPSYQMRRADCVCDKPAETLSRCDRVVGCLLRLRFQRRH